MIGNDLPARLLESGLAAASLRHRVQAHNIANLTTPGFKRARVEFEQHLTAALASGGSPESVRPTVVVEQNTLARGDGNNVDIEGEMTALAENQIWYSALTRQMADHFSRLRSVIHDGRR